MNRHKPAIAAAGGAAPLRALGDAIDAIGSSDFEHAFLTLLSRAAGAEHCAIYRLRHDEMQAFCAASGDGSDLGRRRVSRYLAGQHWRRDPTMAEAHRRAGPRDALLFRVRPKEISDAALRRQIYRRIGERLLVCGRRGDALFGISVLRDEASGEFADRGAATLFGLADALIATAARHASAIFPDAPQAPALASLATIERRAGVVFPGLSRRERQVCARILFGQCVEGMALDLGVSEDTVATYRKRAYARLALSGRHELLRSYLAAH